MRCKICEQKLQSKEAILCKSCKDFLEWKYGSLENYEKVFKKAVRGNNRK